MGNPLAKSKSKHKLLSLEWWHRLTQSMTGIRMLLMCSSPSRCLLKKCQQEPMLSSQTILSSSAMKTLRLNSTLPIKSSLINLPKLSLLRRSKSNSKRKMKEAIGCKLRKVASQCSWLLQAMLLLKSLSLPIHPPQRMGRKIGVR